MEKLLCKLASDQIVLVASGDCNQRVRILCAGAFQHIKRAAVAADHRDVQIVSDPRAQSAVFFNDVRPVSMLQQRLRQIIAHLAAAHNNDLHSKPRLPVNRLPSRTAAGRSVQPAAASQHTPM